MVGYHTSTNYSATLATALNEFHEALTRRWREQVCEAVVADHHDYPVAIRRAAGPQQHTPLWPYWSLPARHHLHSLAGCAYVRWVQAGQQGQLSGVRCDGATDAREPVELVDVTTGQLVTIHPQIECGMGSVLAAVEDWAWGEREAIFHRLPLFDHHDLRALHRAHDRFVSLGARLGLEPTAGSTTDTAFPPMGDRDIARRVDTVSVVDGQGQDWWAGWTGLAAARAKSGFFASVAPTLNNQSRIVGCLANLYSDRAAIIEKGRNDALYWIQWATDSLGETELVTTDRTNGWKVVQGIGATVGVAGAWSGAGAVVGASVSLIGFLGENLDPGGKAEEYANGIEETVQRLHQEIESLHTDLDRLELDLRNAVNRLRGTIHGIHSFNLELYDFTQNAPEGDGRDEPGYTADVDDILRLAERCYQLGDLYERLLPELADTFDADRHLADKDGNATPADQGLIEVRDLLQQFLKTSCGRYLVAGDQVQDAAEAYVQVDQEQQHKFDRVAADWGRDGFGSSDTRVDATTYARATDRSDGYDPHEGHPALGGATSPGAGDDHNYVLDTER